MTALARAGWLLSAIFFATILSSIVHVDYVGASAELALLLIVTTAAWRPDAGVTLLVAVAPVAWYLASRVANPSVPWAETVACATLAGLSLNRAATHHRPRDLPPVVSAPAALFAAILLASLVAGLAVKALRLGPGFTDALVTQLTREYFVDVRGFPGLHAGMLLLEGVALFYLGARLAAEHAGAGDDRARPGLRRLAAAAAAGAALAAALNVARLLRAAARGWSFWDALLDLAQRLRWNVHYPDFNAAGSYFAMAALLAAALAASATGRRRAGWASCTVVIAVALWLTSSRAAVLAAVLALGVILLIVELTRRRARALRAAMVGAAGVVVLLIVALALPQRGTQKSSLIAADVRLGLLQTGARMIASRPMFGIGLGEFYQRSGEFSSPALLATFPVAVHENAHNNFLQVAAELGIAGGVLFAWLMIAPMVAIGRHAVAGGDPFLLLTLAAVAAFALSCLGGHPLLIPEPGYVFWTILGATTGVAAGAGTRRSRWRSLVPIGLAAVALSLPWQLRESMRGADLEHVGIGVSTAWQLSPEDVRYRVARGHATLFVPIGAVRFMVYPVSDQPLRLELTLDRRIADVVALLPRRWNEVTLPGRTTLATARYARLDLRLIDADETPLWISKVQPVH